jgi:hypothetical protein
MSKTKTKESLNTSIERLGPADSGLSDSVSISGFAFDGVLNKKSGLEVTRRHAAIRKFVQQVQASAGLDEHNLQAMAQHFFYSPLFPMAQSEAALNQFAQALKSGDDSLPMLIIEHWAKAECAKATWEHSVVFEVMRLAQTDGVDLSKINIHNTHSDEALPYFQTALQSAPLQKQQADYRAMEDQAYQLFREWGELQFRGVSLDKKDKSSRTPHSLPQPTFIEARTGATAISDGRDLRDWQAVEGIMAMLHAPKDSKMQTRFEPCPLLLSWWGNPTGAQLETLQNELQSMEFDALVTYFVCLSWAIEEFQVTTSIDSIIEAIGRGTDARRSTAIREKWRCKVWRWMLLFDSLAVIGARPGTWREPRDGDKKREKMDIGKLYSQDALLKIIGTRATDQGTFDNSAPPKEITFVAGPWVNQWRGNREILSEFGNVRAIASIPRGKPSGAWAACVGFALQQKWREQAATAPVTRITKSTKEGTAKTTTQKFRPFTRRVLLAQLWRSDVDPDEILKGEHPERAKEYWNAAIVILKKNGVVGIYKEIEPLAATGYGWQDAWLDQPLDIRPTGDNRKDAIVIHDKATAARKRTRSPKAV